MARSYRYYRTDFGELPFDVIHMDLIFDIFDDHTRVDSRLKIKVRNKDLDSLEVNAKNLEIISISCDQSPIRYTYDEQRALIAISFHQPIPAHSECVLRTATICRPSTATLEGLYYDATPPGAPPTQITQCQQWGFQRLVPCIDKMTAKCTYTTTIIADRRYTNLITNGDVIRERHPAGEGRDSIQYANTITPMAPYLFFLGVGTYDTFTREFEYPDKRRFTLELLVPPGTDEQVASHALEVLADAIMWIYLFTGPEQYTRPDERHRIWNLVHERDRLIKSGNEPQRLEEIQNDLLTLTRSIVTGYAYTGTVYREIGMQNSDFGGMENVGNTTITTNRIMPFPEMTDPSFEYMVRVKIHEFYHNLNGSEVTGQSPFEIWLNEAVTVVVEEQNHAFLFGEAYSRLQTILTLLSPEGGTFALDQGPAAMPIEPDGFNDPNELITGVTYVKAPEVVRMMATLMGWETFVQGLHLYHTRYRHGNATRGQWIEAMEEVSGLSLSGMAQTWLKSTGYPILQATRTYDPAQRRLSILLTQKSSQGGDDATVWEFPFRFACVNSKGMDMVDKIHHVTARDTTIVIDDIDCPAFLSLNRGYSFYGKVSDSADMEELLLQVRHDSDMINRFNAWYRIVDREKMRLLLDPSAAPSTHFVDLFIELLSDESLMKEAGGQFLTIFETVEDERFAHHYRALFNTRRTMIRAVAEKYKDRLIALYRNYSRTPEEDTYLTRMVAEIRSRQIKTVCLAALATLDTPDMHRLIKSQFETATSATDRLVAFGLYCNSSAPDKEELLMAYQEQSAQHPVSWEAYLASVAQNSSDDTVSIVRRVEASDAFHIEQANDQRALYVRFAMNRKISLQTDVGRTFMTSMLIRLAPVNEYSTGRALQAFAGMEKMEEEYQAAVVRILVDLMATLTPEKTPSVYNTILRILDGSPHAVRAYESEYGAIPFSIHE
jgi:aminopeptidase N